MNVEEEECPECPAGLPAYLATFADLMSLLMCFFVLLLSFSEMNVEKYKQLSGSMKAAFGVQNKIDASSVPKGTSIIAKEFSPGKPEPTIMNEVQQHSDDTVDPNLQVLCADGSQTARETEATETQVDATEQLLEKLVAQTQADAVEVAQALKSEISAGKIEIEARGRKIVIRIKERGSFGSGSAVLQDEFIPVMDKIREALKPMPGTFAVTGHTDDVPISTYRFRSNWELSSSRAVSVAQELLKTGEMDPELFSIVGLGDVKPLVSNDSRDNRAKNRRVEIVVSQDARDEKILSGEEELPDDIEFTPELIKEAGLTDLEGFEIYSEDPNGEQEALKLDDEERSISVYEPTPEELLTPQNTPEPESLEVEVESATPIDTIDAEQEQQAQEQRAQSQRAMAPDPTTQNTFDLSVDPFAPAVDDAEEDEFF